MRKPDFFIVGAPKSGTTAVARYLAEHPRIFMAEPKEPNYFARNLTAPKWLAVAPPYHRSLDGYLQLFSGATERHIAVGEASTRYLRSEQALNELREFRPDARIVVQLRNPIDVAFAWHFQKLYENQENEPDFPAAWDLQRTRREGRNLPNGLMTIDALFYKKVASLGSQLETLLGIFDRRQVHILLFDDLKADPVSTYESVLSFLGVATDHRTSFPVVNPSRLLRRPKLSALLRARPVFVRRAVDLVKRSTRIADLGMTRMIDRVTLSNSNKPALDPAFRQRLGREFEEEIRKLERILERDLGSWRNSECDPG